MTHVNRRDSAKERYWRRLLARWRASGLSVRAFCQQQQLSEPNFYQWRRIIQQRDQASQPPPTARRGRTRDVATPTPLFVPLEVTPAPITSGDDALEIVLPRGLVLRVRPRFDPATLRQLLKALEEQPC